MWLAKFKIWHKGSILLELHEKYEFSAVSQYLNNFKQKNKSMLMRSVVIWGKDSNKALEVMLNSPKINIVIHEKNQLVFFQTATHSFHNIVTNRKVFLTEPILEENGFQWWSVGSKNREDLMKFYEKLKKLKNHATIEIISIKKTKLFFPQKSQIEDINKKNLELWKKIYNSGYYQYPRKKNLKEISKELDIPYSTLKDTLRKTENSIMKKINQIIE